MPQSKCNSLSHEKNIKKKFTKKKINLCHFLKDENFKLYYCLLQETASIACFHRDDTGHASGLCRL